MNEQKVLYVQIESRLLEMRRAIQEIESSSMNLLEMVNDKRENAGRWMEIRDDDIDYCTCSKCEYKFRIEYLKMIWNGYLYPPYCPACGSRMED